MIKGSSATQIEFEIFEIVAKKALSKVKLSKVKIQDRCLRRWRKLWVEHAWTNLYFLIFVFHLLQLQQIEKSSRLYCQCYGKSGSCIVRICSKRMPPTFKPIGKSLYTLYEKAVYEQPNQRTIENDASYLIRQRQSSSRRQTHVNQIVTSSDETSSLRSVNSVRRRRSRIMFNIRYLKFYERSPDFCREALYARDITNRVCLLHVTKEQSAKGVKSCDQICCRGRGLRWAKREISKNCKFQYCCKVVCDEEVKWVKEYYCLWKKKKKKILN